MDFNNKEELSNFIDEMMHELKIIIQPIYVESRILEEKLERNGINIREIDDTIEHLNKKVGYLVERIREWQRIYYGDYKVSHKDRRIEQDDK